MKTYLLNGVENIVSKGKIAISSFVVSFSKVVLLQRRQKASICGKGILHYTFSRYALLPSIIKKLLNMVEVAALLSSQGCRVRITTGSLVS